jgi:hypothetical protein
MTESNNDALAENQNDQTLNSLKNEIASLNCVFRRIPAIDSD